MLQALCESRADDVVDLLAFEQFEYRLIEEAAIRTQQPDGLAAQMVQGRFNELQHVVGAVGIARTQPEISHHARFGHKGQQRMVR